MPKIILLHADAYKAHDCKGFDTVSFPVSVEAEPYRYGDNLQYTMNSLMKVPNAELVRIGYTGPLVDGGLFFADYNKSFRHVGPFDFWNALKASRDVGALPA